MLKINYLLIFCLFISVDSFSQNYSGQYYSNFEQLKNKTAAGSVDFKVKRLKKGKVKIETTTDSLKKSFLKRNSFAVVFNDSLWICGYRQRIGGFFYTTLTDGNYIVFKGPMKNSKSVLIITSSGLAFGLIGSLISAAIIAPQHYLYVLSMKTGNTKRLTYKYVKQRLIDLNYTDLLKNFQAEEHRKKDTTLLSYIKKINEEMAKNIQH